jgi:uncharacterized protein YbjT (DUF2867 family)
MFLTGAVVARRPECESIAKLRALGAEVIAADLLKPESLTGVCDGISCVIAPVRGNAPGETVTMQVQRMSNCYGKDQV